VKEIPYGKAFIYPKSTDLRGEIIPHPLLPHQTWQRMGTLHEGSVLYHKQWNFWVRAGVKADTIHLGDFFPYYESENAQTHTLLEDAGFTWSTAWTEEEIWSRIGRVWAWMRDRVSVDDAAYATILPASGTWPSILDLAAYYVAHGGRLVWSACFSKAHLFATLLGRVVYPRYRFGIALTHHTEGGAPATASHVYVAAYVADRWFYLDPTASPFEDFPVFANRKSIGVSSFTTVDYQHPFDFIPVPLADFDLVPYLPH
jgi:hypothetical protein